MRAAYLFLALAGLALLVSPLEAQNYYCSYVPPPRAPDMTGFGFYARNQWGMVFGPNYNVRPQFPPFNGMLPLPQESAYNYLMKHGCNGGPAQAVFMGQDGRVYCVPPPPPAPGQQQPIAAFPNHMFVRSPRDYFMVETDPRSSAYNYGMTGSYGLASGYSASDTVGTYGTSGTSGTYGTTGAYGTGGAVAPVAPMPPVPMPPKE